MSVTPSVRIADDGMVAELTLPALSRGTKPPGEALLRELIRTSKIVFGLLDDAFLAALRAHAAHPEREVKTAIALGMPEIHGEDGSLCLTVFVGSQAGHVTQDGYVDYHRRQLGRDVHAGDLLGTIRPAAVGSAGMTVTGQEIPARAGREARQIVGTGIRVSEGGLEVRAEFDGILFATDEHLRVLRSYEVEQDVNYSTGNIDTSYEVNVRGSICSSFSVKAGGPIHVGQHIEDAVVESAASIEVGGGISHRKFGSVRARGAVEAKYALNAEIQSGDSIDLGDSAFHSFLVAKESVRLVSGKGSVVGGQAIAGQSIRVKVAGTRQGVGTVLRVGYDYQGVQHIEKKLRRLEQQMTDLLSMAGPELMGFDGDARKMPKDRRTRKILSRWRVFEKRKRLLFSMRERILRAAADALPGDPFIEILDQIHPGVELIVGSHSLTIASRQSGGRFALNHETNEVERLLL